MNGSIDCTKAVDAGLLITNISLFTPNYFRLGAWIRLLPFPHVFSVCLCHLRLHLQMNESLTQPCLTFKGRKSVYVTNLRRIVLVSLFPSHLYFIFSICFFLGEASFLKSFDIIASSSHCYMLSSLT